MKSSFRRCLACRQRDLKEKLLRLGVVGDTLYLDKEHVLQCRGAYLHQKAECLRKFGQRKQLEYVLRRPSGSIEQTSIQECKKMLDAIIIENW